MTEKFPVSPIVASRPRDYRADLSISRLTRSEVALWVHAVAMLSLAWPSIPFAAPERKIPPDGSNGIAQLSESQ